jgi:hypothetical protein
VIGKLSRYVPIEQRPEIENFLSLWVFLTVACIHMLLSFLFVLCGILNGGNAFISNSLYALQGRLPPFAVKRLRGWPFGMTQHAGFLENHVHDK